MYVCMYVCMCVCMYEYLKALTFNTLISKIFVYVIVANRFHPSSSLSYLISLDAVSKSEHAKYSLLT